MGIIIVCLIILLITIVFIKIAKIMQTKTEHKPSKVMITLYIVGLLMYMLYYTHLGYSFIFEPSTDVSHLMDSLKIYAILSTFWSFIISIIILVLRMSDVKKKRLIIIYLRVFIFISLFYFAKDCYDLKYSHIEGERLFYENQIVFGNFQNYIKSEDFNNEVGCYTLERDKLMHCKYDKDVIQCEHNGEKTEVKDKNLKQLFQPLNKNCYINEFKIYKNKDVCLSVKKMDNEYSFQYISDDEINDILYEKTISFSYLEKNWYMEAHTKALESRDGAYLYNIKKIELR